MSPPSHLKGALVDKYAEIALFDAAENQRVILESQAAAAKKKAEMKKALDQQVRYQQECVVREREEDLEWVRREQERIVIWNDEEKKKVEQTRMKNNAIHHQRQQQLRELAALRAREKEEQGHYDLDILRGIKKEIRMERAKEQIKRESDAENLKRVAEQNTIHLAHLKQQKEQEIADVRKLEAEWAEVLNKQERARDRQLKQTYSRQAHSYGQAASMQETMDRIAREDEERANRHAKELEDAAAKREYDQKAERARLQRETLDVLAIQVREKASRVDADRSRDQMVLARERQDLDASDKADKNRRSETWKRNQTYKAELMAQMRVQEERKVLEPFLMSKAERQMNSALLKRLPS